MAAVDLTAGDRERLIKLAGLLGSSHEGERAAAAAKATTLLHSRGLNWAGLLSGLLVAEPRRYLTRPETRRAAARMGASL